MNALPDSPPSYEQGIEQKLIECGLSAQGVQVSYQDDLQSYEVVISTSANAVPSMFQCIHEAVRPEIVTFDDQELSSRYHAFLEEVYRPEALASAKDALDKRGLLQGLPKRADFASDTLFAEALEDHCGLAKGEAIRPFRGGLVFQTPPETVRDFTAFADRYSCILSAIQLVNAKRELDIGFIGNEAIASDE